MTLLAIDTSTDYLSVALERPDGEVFIFHQQVGQQHAELILPRLERLLLQAEIELPDIDAIIYGQGPGSFTGLRVGAGIAQGLAEATGKPLMPIPTLDNVAAQAPKTEKLLVCLDARMHQVYCACYHTKDSIRCTSTITVQDPPTLTLADNGWTAVGSGLAVYAEQFSADFHHKTARQLPDIRPHAAAYLSLARSGQYPLVDAAQAALLYIRNKVALTAREQKARSA